MYKSYIVSIILIVVNIENILIYTIFIKTRIKVLYF